MPGKPAGRCTPTASTERTRAARAQDLGKRAEAAVVEYLKSAGASIVATNLRVGRLELDIVARHRRVVIVVEVRARGGKAWTSAFGSLDSKKRARVRRAAERLWRDRYRDDATVDRLRIDAASVAFTDGVPTVEYAKAAF